VDRYLVRGLCTDVGLVCESSLFNSGVARLLDSETENLSRSTVVHNLILDKVDNEM
jgi:hypothetical protein